MRYKQQIPDETPDQQRRRRKTAEYRTDTPADRDLLFQAASTLTAVAREKRGAAYPLDDDGNVLRFRAVWGEEVLWCPGDRGGAFWWFDQHRWVEDRSNEVGKRAWAVLRAMEHELDVVKKLPPKDPEDAEAAEEADVASSPDGAAGASVEKKRKPEHIDVWLGRSRTVSAHRRMLDGLRGQLGADLREFDREESDTWLNTPSDLIQLATGIATGPAKPGYLLTRATAVKYERGATCPQFRAAIDTWTCHRPDLATYLQKLLGASLLPGAIGRQLIVIVGSTSANGKTTLGEVVGRVLGDYAGTLAADALMQHGHRPAHDELLAPMLGRRFVFASEGSEHLHWNTALVKLLTGGDMLSIRRIFGRQEQARQTATLFLATNAMPGLGLVDRAIQDRLRLIPFDHHVPREERVAGLAARLVEQEGSGILNWLLEGLAMILKDGLGDPPEAVRAMTDDYFDTVDGIGRYLEERVIRDPSDPASTVSGGDLYADYKAWSVAEGLEPVSIVRFGSRLNAETIPQGRDTSNRKVRLGIALRASETEYGLDSQNIPLGD